MIRRVGKIVALREDKIATYLQLHGSVWPGVVAALLRSNIRNFSIYRHDDLLFSYYEYFGEDYGADMARVAVDPISQRWVKLIEPCQRPLDQRGGQAGWTEMEEVFHLD